MAMAGADTSCRSVRRTEGGNGDILETVASIGGKLASQEEGGGEAAAAVLESLRELQRVRMTFEALEATKIGRAVNALRKTAPSEQARRLAAELYTGWKALADERFRSTRAQQPPPPPKADEGIKKSSSSSSSSPPPQDMADGMKQPATPQVDREVAPTSVVVEPALEKFDSAAIVGKPTSLRVVVKTTNAPAKAAEKPQSRVPVVVRRTTAATTNPAPASNNITRRNGDGPNSKPQAATKCLATASHQGTKTNAAAAKRVSPTGAAAPSTTAKPPPTAPPKPARPMGSSAACKRKAEDAAIFNEARLATARARLQERYKEVDAAKEKRKIQEVMASDALWKTPARQRPASRVSVQYAVPKLRCRVRPAGCPGLFEPVRSSSK